MRKNEFFFSKLIFFFLARVMISIKDDEWQKKCRTRSFPQLPSQTLAQISPNQNFVVCSKSNTTNNLYICNVTSARSGGLKTIACDTSSLACAWSPHSTMIIAHVLHREMCDVEHGVQLWRVDEHGNPTKMLKRSVAVCSRRICALEWSPDGRYVAIACCNGMLRLFSFVSHQKKTWHLSGIAFENEKEEETDRWYCLAWSADGTRLVSGSSLGSVRLWTISKDGELVPGSSFGRHNYLSVRGVAWSPNSKQIMTRGDVNMFKVSIDVWDLDENGNVPGMFSDKTICQQTHIFSGIDAAWSPDGKSIFCISSMRGQILGYDAKTSNLVFSYLIDSYCHSDQQHLRFLNDCQIFANSRIITI
ncbi:WD40 repeat domain-containing protein, partial [Asticcacaulis sp.]|uniref:WD40 repeat domain-containing protein n=1 Tax=Asticcacaulis sp. TaxID=1872648 RepID=UPI0026362E71